MLDDSPLESELARRALAAGEYDVRLFSEGSALLELLAERQLPDVLVLDWVMPGLSGIEVCQYLRSRPETAELPVLLLTTNQRTEQIVQGLAAGANDYLPKPYAAAELRARVDALVRSSALRERAVRAEQLLRSVLSMLPDAVLTFDQTGRLVFANEEAARVFGAGKEALLGRLLGELLPTLSPAVSRAPAGQPALPDVQVGPRSFAPRISISAADDQGRTTLALRDVTDLRAREARRLDFYSMVAHDLRSPLNALHMRSQMLLKGMRGPMPADMRVELEKMGGRIRELTQTVTDFLDIAQMESAFFALEREPVDLAQVCAQVYEEYRPLASANGIELTLNANRPALLLGDSRRLAHVTGNLLANAIKFTREGGRISLEIGGDEQTIELSVQDSGRGISDEAQRRLFTKYERIAGSDSSKIEGTGLGLVIVKEIAEGHGGSVLVRSALGQGSRFSISLPRSVQ